MTRNRWKYLKNLKPAAPRYLHESCKAFMAENPLSAITGVRMPLVPRVVLTGGTYNVGRNAEKRRLRALAG